jgi:hypothetical protein
MRLMRTVPVRVVLAATLLASIAVTVAPGLSAAMDGGAWLDNPKPTAWNQPNAPIPTAPTIDEQLDPRWLATNRWVQSAEDQMVADAGWHLYTAFQAGWNIAIIPGSAGADGMGRPLDYQYFVFKDGVFIGTLAPDPMNSRTDGALSVVYLVGAQTINANFLRYTPTDPLCCPSGSTFVSYTITTSPSGASVVNPVSATTTPNPAARGFSAL